MREGESSGSGGSGASVRRGLGKPSALHRPHADEGGRHDGEGGDDMPSPKMMQLKKAKTVSIAKLVAEESNEEGGAETGGGGGEDGAERKSGHVSEETARKRQQLRSRTRSQLLQLKSRTVSLADLSEQDPLLRQNLELAQDMLEATTPMPERQTELQQKWNMMAGSRVGQSQDGEIEEGEEEDEGEEEQGSGVRGKLGNAVGKIRVQTGLTKLLQAGSSFRAGIKDIQMEEEEMRQCFMSMDIDSTGLLDIDELQHAYAMAGVEISKANLRNIMIYCRKSQLKGKHQHSAAAAAADPDLITFADFREMIKMRKFAAWNSNDITSTADLPLSFGVVASGHRRKHILQSFLANDFLSPGDKLGARLQELQRQSDDAAAAAAAAAAKVGETDGLGSLEPTCFDVREAEELHEKVASRLPHKLQAKMKVEAAVAEGSAVPSPLQDCRVSNKAVEPWMSAILSTGGESTRHTRPDGLATLTKRRVKAHPTGCFLGSAVPAVAPLMPGLAHADGRSYIRRRRPALSSGRVGSSTPTGGLVSEVSSQHHLGIRSRGSGAARFSLPSIVPDSDRSPPLLSALQFEPSFVDSSPVPLRRSAPTLAPPSTGMRVEPSVGDSSEFLPGSYQQHRRHARGPEMVMLRSR